MCGIALYANFKSGEDQDLFDHLYHALLLLMNRGYDSCGMASISDGSEQLQISKTSTENHNPIEHIREFRGRHEGSRLGMVHTRWATHGSKTDVNAHPHFTRDRQIAVSHNGIIDNYLELQEQYGLAPQSETDTEIVALLMEHKLSKYSTKNCEQVLLAFQETVSELSGTWAIILLHAACPRSIFVSVNGSPLVTGVSEHSVMMLASEPAVLAQQYNSWVPVPDGTCFEITWSAEDDRWKIMYGTPGVQFGANQPSITTQDFCSYWPRHNMFPLEHRETIRSQPGNFPHWTLKEIHEQPHTLASAMNFGGRLDGLDKVKLGGLECCADLLKGHRHVLLIGCGTSHHASLIVGKFANKLRMFDSVSVIDASEFEAHDVPKQSTVAILFSQSGETKDVSRALDILQDHECISVGVINSVGSLIARRVDCGSYINAGREVGVASTKSFTSQVIVGLLVTLWFAQNYSETSHLKIRRNTIQTLRNIPKAFSNHVHAMNRQAREICDYVIDRCLARSIFILGRGVAYPTAMEAALKLKELTYIHVEAQCLGSLKHGPFAVLQHDVPIFVLAFSEQDLARHVSAVHEIESRDSPVIVVTSFPDEKGFIKATRVVTVESDDILTANLLGALFFQFLAYSMSLRLGHNPDMPRNLAKCVTVDG